MKRYVIVGLLVLLAVVVSAAPASMLKAPLASIPGISVAQLQGTLWSGSGLISAEGAALGTLRWSFAPAALLKAQAAFDYQLQGNAIALSGQAGRSLSTWQLQTEGTVTSALVNRSLAPYEIRMTGDLTLEDVALALRGQRLESLAGTVHWPGGPVSYPDARGVATRPLPALNAELELDSDTAEPLANVRSDSVNYPLITLRAQDSGFVKISLTRRFTQIVGMPWPGSEPDHAFVLEVEQQVF